MGRNVLLTNAAFVKSFTNISNNVNDKYLLPAIREAQEFGLKNIIGEKLLDKIKELILTKELQTEENIHYKDLLDKAQYYLAYQALSNIVVMLSYKVDNTGVYTTSDEHMDSVSMKEVYNQSEHYQRKAEYYTLELQNFILNNRLKFPEVDACACNTIAANLFSADAGGLVLGGPRGKGGYRQFTKDYIGK